MMPETTEQGSRERKNLKRINVDSWFGKGSSRLEINDMQDFCTQIGSKLQSTNWFTVMKNRSRLQGQFFDYSKPFLQSNSNAIPTLILHGADR